MQAAARAAREPAPASTRGRAARSSRTAAGPRSRLRSRCTATCITLPGFNPSAVDRRLRARCASTSTRTLSTCAITASSISVDPLDRRRASPTIASSIASSSSGDEQERGLFGDLHERRRALLRQRDRASKRGCRAGRRSARGRTAAPRATRSASGQRADVLAVHPLELLRVERRGRRVDPRRRRTRRPARRS